MRGNRQSSRRHAFARPRAISALKALSVAGVSVAMICAGSIGATADDLDDRQEQLQRDIAHGHAIHDEMDTKLVEALKTLMSSRQGLADANAQLALAESNREAAQAEAQRRANELADAERKLSDANRLVAESQAAVEAQRKKAAADLRATQQQNTALLSVGMLFSNSDAGNVSSRIQWAQTLYNANAAELTALTNMQLQLQTQQTNRAQLENEARLAREAADNVLTKAQEARDAADKAAATVQRQVEINTAAEAEARKALEDNQREVAAKQAELEEVSARIVERNKEIERQAEIARQRAAEAEAERQRAAAQAQANETQPSDGSTSTVRPGAILATPTYGPYTSPFGWRADPFYGYTQFHDGLDIGAACGAPMYAAESGRVAERRWNGGYGNQLIIDHGNVGGQLLTTGYNHAQGFTVNVGDWVTRGQQIGYVGTTGYSTGCHQHFQVWVNGKITDPINFL